MSQKARVLIMGAAGRDFHNFNMFFRDNEDFDVVAFTATQIPDIEGRTFDHDPKYLNLRIGMNSRMDTIQAAVLLQKLSIFADEIEARNRVAARYAAGLSDVVAVPKVIEGGVSVWAQYTIEVGDRDGLIAHLKGHEIPTAVYYPIPIHRQDVYSAYPAPGGLPVTDAKAGKVMSLPMHPYLTPEDQDAIIAAIRAFAGRNA